jgi:hypothetical protein
MNDWHSASDDAALVEFGPVHGLRVSGVGEPGGPEHTGGIQACGSLYGCGTVNVHLVRGWRGRRIEATRMLLAAVLSLLSVVSAGWGGWALLARSGGLFLRLGLAAALSSRRLLPPAELWGTAAPDVWAIRSPGSVRQGSGGSRCFPGSPS